MGDTKTKVAKWRDSYFLKAHQLAQAGHSQRDIAACLGVSWQAFSQWLRLKPALRQAIADAKTPAKVGKSSHNRALAPTGMTFVDYAYGQLPPNLQELWERLEKLTNPDEKPKAGLSLQIDRLFDRCGIREARKSLWFHALIRTNFNGNEACRICNVSQTAVQKWFKEDPAFRELVATLPVIKKQFAEGALWRLVAAGDSSCVQFACKALMPETFNPAKNINVSGNINHATPDVSRVLEAMPIEHRRAYLEAMRKVKDNPQLPEGEIVASYPAKG
jgi:hypothetical protein